MVIAVINYNMGNIKSVENAFRGMDIGTLTTGDPETINRCTAVVLPGVGSFKDAIRNLKKLGLYDVIKNIISANKPFLGICIGLQVLLKYGTEGGVSKGLDVFAGTVEKIPSQKGIKIPHMGWNKIRIIKENSRLFKGIKQSESFYFVHSYFVRPAEPGIVSSMTDYGTDIVSSIEKNNCFGVQFHPEKSSSCGLLVLKNFADIVLESGQKNKNR